MQKHLLPEGTSPNIYLDTILSQNTHFNQVSRIVHSNLKLKNLGFGLQFLDLEGVLSSTGQAIQSEQTANIVVA